jgi:hypothetical protein
VSYLTFKNKFMGAVFDQEFNDAVRFCLMYFVYPPPPHLLRCVCLGLFEGGALLIRRNGGQEGGGGCG